VHRILCTCVNRQAVYNTTRSGSLGSISSVRFASAMLLFMLLTALF
jgi:hypothetical protein